MSLRNTIRDMMPGAAHRAQLAVRKAPIFRNAGVIFVHIPKNAGASINHVLYGQFVGHIQAKDLACWTPKLWQSLPSLALARNPWDRCLSAYLFACAGAGTGVHSVAEIANPKQYAVPEFASFSRFVQEWLPAKSLSQRDQIFRTQSDFVTDRKRKLIVDHMGRTENMPAVETYLSELLKKPVKIVKTNTTKREKESYHSYYSASDRDVVAKLYEEDIQRFGYEF